MQALAPPEKSEAPEAAATATEALVQPSTPHSADLDSERKRFANFQAEAALLGFALSELAGGGFLISRWDRVAHLSDLAGVRSFLNRVRCGG